MERSLVFIKPDGVKRGLIGEVITRFEQKSLSLLHIEMMQLTEAQSDAHYQEHTDKAFYPSLREFIISGPIVMMVIEGENAITVIRQMVGATNGQEALQGTIRGDYAMSNAENIVHASDSPESATRELGIFFGERFIG